MNRADPQLQDGVRCLPRGGGDLSGPRTARLRGLLALVVALAVVEAVVAAAWA
jgi:hypothetical protein